VKSFEGVLETSTLARRRQLHRAARHRHGVKALTPGRLVDSFTPQREDFLG
jgi:hypothetical protein